MKIEGIIWILFLADSLIYNVLAWSQGKWHKKAKHWISKYFPMNKLVGVLYLGLVIWIGSALYRMGVLAF